MATTPLSGVLSPTQIAVLQQARAALARSIAPEQAGTPSRGRAADSPAAPAPRGRGQIVNIVV
jgi:hypothetical protein